MSKCIISDLKEAILALDVDFDAFCESQAEKSDGHRLFSAEIAEFKIVVIDFILLQINPEKAEACFDDAVEALHNRYMHVMLEATK